MQLPIHTEDVQALLDTFQHASVPPDLRAQLASGGVVLMIARNSGQAGRDPAVAAAKSLESALTSLASFGLDYGHLVPGRDELVRRLRDGEVVTSTDASGGRFKNTFVVIDLRPIPLVLLLSMGSAKKIDVNFTQPFVHFLATVCAEVRPALLYAARIDRLVRHAWAFGEPMTVLEAIGGYAGDERGMFVRPRGAEAFQVFFDAASAQQGADTLPRQSRRGQASATDGVMVDGRVRYGVGVPPPAGIARVRMRAGASEGSSELYLEMPDVLPSLEAVAYGLPEVYDEHGRHVDQVANVMWALSVLGREEWPDREVARELVRRRFSTTGLRSARHDASAVWTSEDATRGDIIDGFYRRLEFYETGRLECRSEEFGSIIVDKVLPPQGSWASGEDFQRIRNHLAEGQDRYSNRAKRTFAGLHVRVNGVPSRMYLREDTTYRVRAHGTSCTVPGRVSVTHEQLSQAIVTAIANAGDNALQIVPLVGDASDPLLRKLDADRRPIEAELTTRNQILKSLRQRLDETLDDGTPVVTGKLAAEVNKEYNVLAEKAAENEVAIAELERAAEQRRQALRSDTSRVRVDALLDMVASLRDPSQMTYKSIWRATVHDLELTTTDVTEHHHVGQRYELRGWLGLGDDQHSDQTFRLPLSATWTTGPASEIPERLDAIINGMRRGEPFGRSDVAGAKHLLALLCSRLGPPGRLLAACDDARILRIAMAVTVDRGERSLDAIAAELQEPCVLVDRVNERFSAVRERGHWYAGSSSTRAALYALAAAGGGTVSCDDMVPAHASSWAVVRTALGTPVHRKLFESDSKRAQLVARCDCSPDLVPEFAEMLIAEPLGPVCRRCWHDRHGVHWPQAQYKRFILEMGDTRPRRRHPRRR